MSKPDASRRGKRNEAGYSPEYTVGYKRPPQQHRFRKGLSGNPKGRPKSPQRNLLDDIRDLLDEEVALSNGSRMSKAEAFVRKIVNEAMKGDQKAFAKFIRLAQQAGLLRDLHPQKTSNILYVDVLPNWRRKKDDEA
jgi:Family of unknown function (DUF5681)